MNAMNARNDKRLDMPGNELQQGESIVPDELTHDRLGKDDFNLPWQSDSHSLSNAIFHKKGESVLDDDIRRIFETKTATGESRKNTVHTDASELVPPSDATPLTSHPQKTSHHASALPADNPSSYAYPNLSSSHHEHPVYILQSHDHHDVKPQLIQSITGMLSTDEKSLRLPKLSEGVTVEYTAQKKRKDFAKHAHQKHQFDIEKMPETVRENFCFSFAAEDKENGYFGYWGKNKEWVLLEVFDTTSTDPSAVSLFFSCFDALQKMYETCRFMQQGKYLDCIEYQSKLYLITSCRVGKSIKKYFSAIHEDKETKLRLFMLKMMDVFEELHDIHHIVCGHLNADCIIYDKKVKGIMGIGEYLLLPKAKQSKCFSSGYIAPELFTDDMATPAADYYSLGMIAIECLTGLPPKKLSNDRHGLRYHAFLPENLSAEMNVLLMALTDPNPNRRLDSYHDMRRVLSDRFPVILISLACIVACIAHMCMILVFEPYSKNSVFFLVFISFFIALCVYCRIEKYRIYHKNSSPRDDSLFRDEQTGNDNLKKLAQHTLAKKLAEQLCWGIVWLSSGCLMTWCVCRYQCREIAENAPLLTFIAAGAIASVTIVSMVKSFLSMKSMEITDHTYWKLRLVRAESGIALPGFLVLSFLILWMFMAVGAIELVEMCSDLQGTEMGLYYWRNHRIVLSYLPYIEILPAVGVLFGLFAARNQKL